MLVEIFLILSAFAGAAILLSTLIDWAEQIVIGIAGAILGVLYVTRRAAGALLEVFTQTRSGKWMTTTREVNESELPDELRSISKNERNRVAEYRPN